MKFTETMIIFKLLFFLSSYWTFWLKFEAFWEKNGRTMTIVCSWGHYLWGSEWWNENVREVVW